MRVLIVDDEAPARAKVRRHLAEEPDVEIVGEAEDGVEAVERIAELAPDLVFLDVQMPRLDGFGVIEEVGADAMPAVVFVTAFDEHALKAFEVRALDYLLKPVTPDRFRAAVERARAQLGPESRPARAERLEGMLESLPAERRRPLRRMLVQAGNRALLVPVDRVDRFEADRNYVHLHVGAEKFTVRATITALAARLDPETFLRINRSEIVRLDAVKELHPWFHGDYRVVMKDGATLTWSRRFRAASVGEFGPD